MSDVVEEYQEQVLEDLSDIKESVTTDSGYQEKVLDDLDDIKESVLEDQEYYDEKYQKKVLGSLRSIQKSVEALNLNYNPIDIYSNIYPWYYYFNQNNFLYSNPNKGIYLFSYSVSDYDTLYLDLKNPITGGVYGDITKYFLSNISPSSLSSYANNYVPSESFVFNPGSLVKEPINNSNHLKYFYVVSGSDPQCSLFYGVESSDSSDVTSGSAVIVDGIDTLIQITTFQGFASALLTGILLFLVFVKGLRR